MFKLCGAAALLLASTVVSEAQIAGQDAGQRPANDEPARLVALGQLASGDAVGADSFARHALRLERQLGQDEVTPRGHGLALEGHWSPATIVAGVLPRAARRAVGRSCRRLPQGQKVYA